MFPLLLSLFSPDAAAFCGTYVGHAGAELYNHVSQVALVREGDRTTLTLANDYEGEATDFALVIPVPEVLRAADVQVVDGRIFADLDAYSSPRLVEYTCDDQLWPTQELAGGSAACGGAPQPPGPVEVADGVFVESAFDAGEYAITVLSAEASGDLFGWLDANGYQPHPDAAELLQEYIDQDLYFLAAQVRVDSPTRKQLSPLQLSYRSEDLVLPIRIGTASSPGTQDVIVYGITPADQGSLAIANYPRLEVEDECMAIIDGELGRYYAGVFDRLTADEPAAWVEEYSWQPTKCDPCVGDPPHAGDLRTLGWHGEPGNAHFTRLHVRYEAHAATEDLLLYTTGNPTSSQIRYIEYAHELEDWLPVCGLGHVENPGSCWDEDERRRRLRQASAPSPLWLLGLLAPAVALGRRRR